jgi:hypothetical protein
MADLSFFTARSGSSLVPMSRSPPPPPPVYAVPRRFGVGALLILMAAFGGLFAILRANDAPVGVYIFLGLEAVVVGLAQMRFGESPRLASMVSGALLLPFSMLVATLVVGRSPFDAAVFDIGAIVILIPVGAALGYLTGALMSGCFLVSDMLSAYVKRRRAPELPPEMDIVEAELVESGDKTAESAESAE